MGTRTVFLSAYGANRPLASPMNLSSVPRVGDSVLVQEERFIVDVVEWKIEGGLRCEAMVYLADAEDEDSDEADE